MLVFRQIKAEMGVSERDVELAVTQSSQADPIMTNTTPKCYVVEPIVNRAIYRGLSTVGQQKTGVENS